MKMCGKNKRIINFIQVLILLVTFLIAAVPMPLTAADRGDSVKDKPLKKHPLTLEGKALLNHPITGATVQIYDLSGSLLYSVESATGENGSFSITRPLPKSFWIEITDGWMDGEPFDHDVRRYIRLFKEKDYYKVNAVTTLMAEYQARHPKLSHMQVKKAVANHLSIPDSIDLDEIIYSSEWFCYHFSHYLFMKEAEVCEGLTQFISQLGDEIEAGETRSFYDTESVGSSLFQDAMAALLEGAMSEFGGEGAGWILGLLNHGGGDDQRFIDMQTDLNEILNDLSQIIGLLEGLAKQLALDTNRVETYIEGINAQAAITTIKTHYGPEDKDQRGSTNTLKYYSFLRTEDSDPTTKDQIARLVTNINGAWDIETKVMAIHDAIIPDIGNTEGLLDLWTNEFLLQGHVSDDQLMDYYKTLETYFGVLLFYQFKGANIVVEAQNYQSSSGALSYLTGTFQPQIKEQTDRFLQCVTKLIANNCGLYWESKFLPSTAQEIFARATWFISQTLGEDLNGSRVGAFGTSNLVDDIVKFAVGTPSPWHEAYPVRTEIEFESKAYDYWGTLNEPDLNTLRIGTRYTLSSGDFDDREITPGTYKAYYEPGEHHVTPWVHMGNLVVKRYTKNYIEDPDGEIAYGYLLKDFRRGGKEAMMDPSVFERKYLRNNHTGHVYTRDIDNLNDSGLHLYLHGENDYCNSASKIDMKVEWFHPFTFEGSESTTAYLNIAGEITGRLFLEHGTNWNNSATIWYHIGIVDATHGKILKRIDHKYEAEVGTIYPKKTLNEQISFTLEPGVEYYVYANVQGYGENSNGSYYFKIDMSRLTHLSLTFVNSEF